MGLLSWLFPSPEDRVRKARQALAENRPADARLELLDLDGDEPRALLLEAETALARKNLDEALRWAEAGDEARVAMHLELAERFQKGGLDEQFRAVRRTLRETREARSAEERRQREEREARLMQVDPLGLAGRSSLLGPSLPADLAAEDAEELAARLDLLIAGYPDDLRDRVEEVGAPFARAVLDLDAGRPDLALPALLDLDANHPLVCFETARAAMLLGDPAAAARTLKRFPGLAGGHRQMGNLHTGAMLGQLQAESGDLAGAVATLDAARAQAPEAAGYPLAQILVGLGRLADAEQVVRGLITRNPKVQPYYALLAHIRLKGGFRVEAMSALERGLAGTSCHSGKCGTQRPDPTLVRQLAILYLEDGLEKDRALELADDARTLVERPGFEDLYLAALAARARGADEAPRLTQAVWSQVGDDEARRAHVGRYLPAA